MEYVLELDRPWGNYKVNLLYRKKDAEEGDEGFDLAELTEDWVKDYFMDTVEPEPVS